MWVYRKVGTGKELEQYEVGYYHPSERGWEWFSDEIFPGVFSARRRVCYLNGGGAQ